MKEVRFTFFDGLMCVAFLAFIGLLVLCSFQVHGWPLYLAVFLSVSGSVTYTWSLWHEGRVVHLIEVMVPLICGAGALIIASSPNVRSLIAELSR